MKDDDILARVGWMPLEYFYKFRIVTSGLIFTLILTFIPIWSTLHCSEAAAGVNRISYFVAVNVAQIPIIVITPVVYLSLLYPPIAPRTKKRCRLI